jgi:hypothetical protein
MGEDLGMGLEKEMEIWGMILLNEFGKGRMV